MDSKLKMWNSNKVYSYLPLRALLLLLTLMTLFSLLMQICNTADKSAGFPVR